MSGMHSLLIRAYAVMFGTSVGVHRGWISFCFCRLMPTWASPHNTSADQADGLQSDWSSNSRKRKSS